MLDEIEAELATAGPAETRRLRSAGAVDPGSAHAERITFPRRDLDGTGGSGRARPVGRARPAGWRGVISLVPAPNPARRECRIGRTGRSRSAFSAFPAGPIPYRKVLFRDFPAIRAPDDPVPSRAVLTQWALAWVLAEAYPRHGRIR